MSGKISCTAVSGPFSANCRRTRCVALNPQAMMLQNPPITWIRLPPTTSCRLHPSFAPDREHLSTSPTHCNWKLQMENSSAMIGRFPSLRSPLHSLVAPSRPTQTTSKSSASGKPERSFLAGPLVRKDHDVGQEEKQFPTTMIV